MEDNQVQKKIDDICKKRKNVSHNEQVELLAKITNQIQQFIRQENNNSDSTGGAFDLLSDLAESVQEDFDELIDVDRDKKKFIKALSKIFALLLNTNVNSVEKIKRIIKITTETTLKIWQGPRLQ